MGAINISSVGKVYPNGTRALEDVNIEINDGEFVVLVGPSGCGKTTLLRMVAGLEDITEGEISIGDNVVNDVAPKELILAIDHVINDPPYYSKTVMKLLRKQVSSDMLLDLTDRKILYELSIGTKMRDMSDIVCLSIPGIQKRKRHLKQIFGIESPDDKELVLIAREKGFI